MLGRTRCDGVLSQGSRIGFRSAAFKSECSRRTCASCRLIKGEYALLDEYLLLSYNHQISTLGHQSTPDSGIVVFSPIGHGPS